MRPKVVIDISPLGFAQARKSYARGIHRVAQHTVMGLVEANEVDLHFVATSDLAGAFDWLRERGLAPEKTLSWRRGQLALSRWATRTTRWIERTLPDRRLHMRMTRWLLQQLAVKADGMARNISPRALRGAHIYHSTLAPIPAAVRSRDDIRQFLTVVDVIPLTNPTSVGGKGVPFLRKQLDSLGESSFAFSISETVRMELLSVSALKPDHVFVTPLAASRAVFHPVPDRSVVGATLARHSIPAGNYFLTLSSFDPRKNFEHVVRCFQKLVQANALDGASLVIVGSNPERNRHLDDFLAETPQARQRIVTPGFIPDEDLAAIYTGALAFLFPSLSEGFGIPVLEAMQCGTPVISSNAPALPEVVGDGGILLDPNDVDAWCAVMKRIAHQSDFRESLRTGGFERAKFFSWERFVEATMEGYRSSLGMNPARQSA